MQRGRVSVGRSVLVFVFAAACSNRPTTIEVGEAGASCMQDIECESEVCEEGVCAEPSGSGAASGGGSSGTSADAGARETGACAFYYPSTNRLLCEQRTSASACSGKFFGLGTTCVGFACAPGNNPANCTIGGATPAPTKGQVVVWTDQPRGWAPRNWKGGGDYYNDTMTLSLAGATGAVTAGKLTSAPSCGAAYGFTKSLDPGSYTVFGKVYFLKDIYGNSYSPYSTSASFRVTAGTCTQVVIR
jgi:hypothetical protein